jgi:hypothetical protein
LCELAVDKILPKEFQQNVEKMVAKECPDLARKLREIPLKLPDWYCVHKEKKGSRASFKSEGSFLQKL